MNASDDEQKCQPAESAFFRSLVEHHPDAVCCWLPDTAIVYANGACGRILGRAAGELIGWRWLELVPPRAMRRTRQRVERLLASSGTDIWTVVISLPAGPRRWVEWTSKPVFDAKGKLQYLQSIGRDLSEKRHQAVALAKANQALATAHNERQVSVARLSDQQRLRALGQMASGIAHDFNNTIAVVSGVCDLLKMKLAAGEMPSPAKLGHYVDMMHTAASDAGVTVNRLKTFYRTQETRAFVAVSLNELVRQTLDLTRYHWETQAQAEGIAITVDTRCRARRYINGDPAALRETLINLILNAVAAMPQGGTLTMTTEDDAAGRMVSLSVADTGIGMDESTRQNCLKPFFTTKGAGGTGLGLCTVQDTADRHSAELRLDSAPGLGTTFRLRFPALDDSGNSATPMKEKTLLDPHRLLVVDDDADVRELLVCVLQELGHMPVPAENAEAALALLDTQAFSAVITDLVMPGMNGKQLASAIRTRLPNMPILMLTGFSPMENESSQAESTIDGVIAKPFLPNQLQHALKAALLKHRLTTDRPGNNPEPARSSRSGDSRKADNASSR